jgi:peptide/nickel transport system substrate-binding protein
MIELEAYPDFYRGKPPIEQLIIRRGNIGHTEFQTGNVDIMFSSFMFAKNLMARDDKFRFYPIAVGGPVSLVWNIKNPIFQDKMIRRALTMAIDRRTLFSLYHLPPDLPITEGPYSDSLYESRQLKAGWPYEPEEAKKILDAAGWSDKNSEGIREKNGQPFHFVVIVSRWNQAAIVIQSQLLQIGVKMEIRQLADELIVQRYKTGDFDAVIPRRTNEERIGILSWNGYVNPRVKELMQALNDTFDLSSKNKIYAELSDIFYDEIPGTFLFPRPWGGLIAHRSLDRGREMMKTCTKYII